MAILDTLPTWEEITELPEYQSMEDDQKKNTFATYSEDLRAGLQEAGNFDENEFRTLADQTTRNHFNIPYAEFEKNAFRPERDLVEKPQEQRPQPQYQQQPMPEFQPQQQRQSPKIDPNQEYRDWIDQRSNGNLIVDQYGNVSEPPVEPGSARRASDNLSEQLSDIMAQPVFKLQELKKKADKAREEYIGDTLNSVMQKVEDPLNLLGARQDNIDGWDMMGSSVKTGTMRLLSGAAREASAIIGFGWDGFKNNVGLQDLLPDWKYLEDETFVGIATNAARDLDKLADDISITKNFQESTTDLLLNGEWEQGGKQLAFQSGEQIPQIIYALLMGVAGMAKTGIAISMGLMAAGQQMNQLDKDQNASDMSEQQKRVNSLVSGAVEMATERYLGAIPVINRFFPEGDKTAKELFKYGFRQYLKDSILSAWNEGAEELVSGVAGLAIDKLTGYSDPDSDLPWDQWAAKKGWELADQFLIGSVMGGGMAQVGSVSVAAQAGQTRNAVSNLQSQGYNQEQSLNLLQRQQYESELQEINQQIQESGGNKKQISKLESMRAETQKKIDDLNKTAEFDKLVRPVQPQGQMITGTVPASQSQETQPVQQPGDSLVRDILPEMMEKYTGLQATRDADGNVSDEDYRMIREKFDETKDEVNAIAVRNGIDPETMDPETELKIRDEAVHNIGMREAEADFAVQQANAKQTDKAFNEAISAGDDVTAKQIAKKKQIEQAKLADVRAAIDVKQKEFQDAVRQQESTQVDVGQQSENGGTLGEGNTQGETVAGTQEGTEAQTDVGPGRGLIPSNRPADQYQPDELLSMAAQRHVAVPKAGLMPEQILEKVRQADSDRTEAERMLSARAGSDVKLGLPEKLTDEQIVAKSFLESLGKRVVVFDSDRVPGEIQGFIGTDNSQVIALNNRSRNPIVAVAAHELNHSLKTDSPDAYNRMVDTIRNSFEQVNGKGSWDDMMVQEARARMAAEANAFEKSGMTDEADQIKMKLEQAGNPDDFMKEIGPDLTEEIISDRFGDMVMDPKTGGLNEDFLRSIAKTNPTVWDRFKEFVYKMLDKFPGSAGRKLKSEFDAMVSYVKETTGGIDLAELHSRIVNQLGSRELQVLVKENDIPIKNKFGKALSRKDLVDSVSSFDPDPGKTSGTSVTPRGGVYVDYDWDVVDAKDLIDSNNQAFPEEWQNRNREDSAKSSAQIESISLAPQSSRLGENATTDAGALIIDENGMVIAGNGRKMGIEKAYSTGRANSYVDPANGMTYRKMVEERAGKLGKDISGMESPVLVKRIRDIWTQGNNGKRVPADMYNFMRLSNTSSVQELSEAEKAVNDANTVLNKGLIEIWNPSDSGDILAASNKDFISKFLHSVNDESLYTADGKYAAGLGPRMRNAVLGLVLGERNGRGFISKDASAFIQKIVEQKEAEGVKNIVDGIVKAGGPLVRLKAKPEYDIAGDLRNALQRYIEIKGQLENSKLPMTMENIDAAMDVPDMFSGSVSDQEKNLVWIMAENRRSGKRVSDILSEYGRIAEGIDTNTDDMFGMPSAPKEYVLQRAVESMGNEENLKFSVGDKLKNSYPPIDKEKPVYANVKKSPGYILMESAHTMQSWPEIIKTFDGTTVLLQNPEDGSLAKRAKHLVWDNLVNRLSIDKAKWLPNVPTTLSTGSKRIVDPESGNKIYVKRYAEGHPHMVVVTPDGRVDSQGEMDSKLITQFPYEKPGRQEEMIIDKERENGLGLRSGASHPAPEGSLDQNPSQRAFQGYNKADQENVKDGIQFSISGTDKNLLVAHNLSEEKLRHAAKLGGFPIPSVAVIRTDKSPFTGFGDISLIASKDLIDPKLNRSAKTFDADVYSPRYPNVSYKVNEKAYDKSVPDNLPEGMKYPGIDRVKELGLRAYLDSTEAMYQFLKEKGLAPDPTDGDNFKIRHAVYEIMKDPKLSSEFSAWVNDNYSNVIESERIFNGYTNAGTRRYLPHNLETVLKLMKKSLRDGENFNYGVGSIRSNVANKFRSVKDIQNNRDRIVTEEDFKKVKADIDTEFNDLTEYLFEQRRVKPQYGLADAIADDLKALAQGDRKYLLTQYLATEPLKRMATFLDKLRNMPTEYFESKIQRAVALQEFSGAVVPETVSPDVEQILTRAGIEVEKYQKGDNEERKQAVDRLSEKLGLKFSVSKAEDSRYLELAKDPEKNREELQKMVDEAAKKAGYDTNPMYHGTAAEFNVFDSYFSGQNFDLKEPWFFFMSDKLEAEGYAKRASRETRGKPKVVKAYIKLDNPYLIEENSDGAGEISLIEGRNGLKSEVISALESDKYDGVVAIDTYDKLKSTGKHLSVIVAKTSSQIKSADPVTYDDNGNVIPLSKRFNASSNDIRFSVATRENLQSSIDKAKKDYDFVGIRTTDDPTQVESRKWVDGFATDETIGGLSVTDVDFDWYSQHMEKPKSGYYLGKYIQVVGSNSVESGEDAGELIMKNPVIVDTFLKNADIRLSVANQGTVVLGEYDQTDAAEWKRQLDGIRSGTTNPRQLLQFGKTPGLIIVSGADQLPMVMGQHVIRKATETKHNVPMEVIENLHRYLSDPIMIADSMTVPDSLIVFLDKFVGKLPIMVAIHLNKKSEMIEVNNIASVYERNSFGIMSDLIKNGMVHYSNREKIGAWTRWAGLQLPGDRVRRNNSKILHEYDFVKKPDVLFSVSRTDQPANKDVIRIINAFRKLGSARPTLSMEDALRKRPLSMVYDAVESLHRMTLQVGQHEAKQKIIKSLDELKSLIQSKLPPEDRGKMNTYFKRIAMASTLYGKQREMQRAMEQIDRILDHRDKNKALATLMNIIKQERIALKKASRSERSKILRTPEVNQKIKEYIDRLTGSNIQDLVRIQQQLSEINPSDPLAEALKDDITSAFGKHYKSMNARELWSAVNDLRLLRQTGSTAYEIEQYKKDQDFQQFATDAASAIVKSTGKPMMGIAEAAVEASKIKNIRKKNVNRFISGQYWGIMRPERILEWFEGDQKTELKDRVFGRLLKAERAKINGLRSARENFKRIYGNLDIAKITDPKYGSDIKVGGKTLRFTQETMMHIYAHSQNQGGLNHLAGTFGGDLDNVLDAVGKYLPQKLVDAVNEQIKYYDDVQFKRVSTMFERLTNVPMEKVEKYFPILGLDVEMAENAVMADLAAQISARRGGVGKAFTKGRVESFTSFTSHRYFDTVIKNMMDTEHYISYAEAVRDANKVLRDPQMRKAFRHKSEEAHQALLDWVSAVAYGKTPSSKNPLDKLSDYFRKSYPVAVLAGNLTTVLQQPSSLIAGMSMVDSKEAIKAISKTVANPAEVMKMLMGKGDTMQFIFERSELMQERAKGAQQEIIEMMEQGAANEWMGTRGIWQKIKEGGMAPMQSLDVASAAIVWMAKYNEVLNKTSDESKAIEAADEVIRKTQSQSGILHLPALYRGGGLAKAYAMFTNQQNQQLNMLIHDTAEQFKKNGFISGTKMILLAAILPALWVYSATNGFRLPFWREDEPDDYEGFLETFAGQFLGGMGIWGRVVTGLLRKFVTNPIRETHGLKKESMTYVADMSPASLSALGSLAKGDVTSAALKAGGVPFVPGKRAAAGWDKYQETGDPRYLLFNEKNIEPEYRYADHLNRAKKGIAPSLNAFNKMKPLERTWIIRVLQKSNPAAVAELYRESAEKKIEKRKKLWEKQTQNREETENIRMAKRIWQEQ